MQTDWRLRRMLVHTEIAHCPIFAFGRRLHNELDHDLRDGNVEVDGVCNGRVLLRMWWCVSDHNVIACG